MFLTAGQQIYSTSRILHRRIALTKRSSPLEAYTHISCIITAHCLSEMASIFGRKRDLVYLVFFLIHIPVMFCTCYRVIPLMARDDTDELYKPLTSRLYTQSPSSLNSSQTSGASTSRHTMTSSSPNLRHGSQCTCGWSSSIIRH